MYTFLRGNI